MIQPIELRIEHNIRSYVVRAVFGLMHTEMFPQTFASFKQANDWCKENYPNVPRIRG